MAIKSSLSFIMSPMIFKCREGQQSNVFFKVGENCSDKVRDTTQVFALSA